MNDCEEGFERLEAEKRAEAREAATRERIGILEIKLHTALEELKRCRAILDLAGDHSTSIHGGIQCLVEERRRLVEERRHRPTRLTY